MPGPQQQQLIRATIRSIWQETPTVKGLQLAVDAVTAMQFKPGQWVDFHAPGVPNIGGYSITSTPRQLRTSGTFDLAVKGSRHPCAQWVHTQAAPGDEVDVQVGGSFTLAAIMRRPTLFVAGGIGITCLSSMLGHLAEAEVAGQQAPPPPQQEQQQEQQQLASVPVPAPLLMYSASSPGEFALLPRLLAWHQQGLLQLQLYVTQSSSQGDADDAAAAFSDSLPPGVACHQGRITTAQLQTALEGLRQQPSQGVDAYVCGPPQMTDDVVEQLKGLGLPAADIRTEKWW